MRACELGGDPQEENTRAGLDGVGIYERIGNSRASGTKAKYRKTRTTLFVTFSTKQNSPALHPLASEGPFLSLD